MNEIKSGMTSTEDLEPSVLKETSATALVDGNNLIGIYLTACTINCSYDHINLWIWNNFALYRIFV